MNAPADGLVEPTPHLCRRKQPFGRPPVDCGVGERLHQRPPETFSTMRLVGTDLIEQSSIAEQGDTTAGYGLISVMDRGPQDFPVILYAQRIAFGEGGR